MSLDTVQIVDGAATHLEGWRSQTVCWGARHFIQGGRSPPYWGGIAKPPTSGGQEGDPSERRLYLLVKIIMLGTHLWSVESKLSKHLGHFQPIIDRGRGSKESTFLPPPIFVSLYCCMLPLLGKAKKVKFHEGWRGGGEGGGAFKGWEFASPGFCIILFFSSSPCLGNTARDNKDYFTI